MAALDLTLETYGRLWVLHPVGKDRHRRTLWRCLCECGNVTTVMVGHLRSGNTQSCGCLDRDTTRAAGEANRRHGHSSAGGTRNAHPLYNTWLQMRRRCNDPTTHNYALYGERGIRVCARWDSFQDFLVDVGERPAGTTLDRINNDGNYEPGNVRWATAIEQSRNRRPTKRG